MENIFEEKFQYFFFFKIQKKVNSFTKKTFEIRFFGNNITKFLCKFLLDTKFQCLPEFSTEQVARKPDPTRYLVENKWMKSELP